MEIIDLIYNPVNYWWVSHLDVIFPIIPLAIETGLFLLFLAILKNRGTKRGKYLLLFLSVVLVLFALPSFLDVLTLAMNPISYPPPGVWVEPDIAFAASIIKSKAIVNAIIIFCLSFSYTCVRFQ
jgi:hypothetical protein